MCIIPVLKLWRERHVREREQHPASQVVIAASGCAVRALGGGGWAGVVTRCTWFRAVSIFKLPNMLALAVLFALYLCYGLRFSAIMLELF